MKKQSLLQEPGDELEPEQHYDGELDFLGFVCVSF